MSSWVCSICFFSFGAMRQHKFAWATRVWKVWKEATLRRTVSVSMDTSISWFRLKMAASAWKSSCHWNVAHKLPRMKHLRDHEATLKNKTMSNQVPPWQQKIGSIKSCSILDSPQKVIIFCWFTGDLWFKGVNYDIRWRSHFQQVCNHITIPNPVAYLVPDWTCPGWSRTRMGFPSGFGRWRSTIIIIQFQTRHEHCVEINSCVFLFFLAIFATIIEVRTPMADTSRLAEDILHHQSAWSPLKTDWNLMRFAPWEREPMYSLNMIMILSWPQHKRPAFSW